MKIEIDVSDFYLDEDYSLEEGLKKHIIYETISTIGKSIKDKVETEIHAVVEKYVLDELSSEIFKTVSTGKIKSKFDKKEMTINEYVQECMLSNDTKNWQNFEKTIREVAKDFCDEMRKRYDLNFASNIVANLIDNKLIKEDVVKMLLNKNT